MSSQSGMEDQTNGGSGYDLRSRKPANPQVTRTKESNGNLRSSLPAGIASSGVSSGTSTPIPQDAPPSVQATSSARRERRAEQKRRMFPTIDYESRVSHFDPRSDYHDFRGFFVLFWIGLAIMVITTGLRNLKESGYPLSFRQRETFTKNIWELGISDAVMVCTTFVNIPLNLLYKNGGRIFRWNNAGLWIQSVFEAAWMLFWTSWPFLRDWTWTAQVCFTLHLMVLFMKLHSFAFYGGHLATTWQRLHELDHPNDKLSNAPAVKYPSSRTHVHEMVQEQQSEEEAEKKQSISRSKSSDLVSQLREDLALELVSPLGHVTYPQNLTLENYIDFLCCPTLCYELEYPRTESRSFMELFYKTLAVFGCVFLLTVISEEYIMPILSDAASQLEANNSWQDSGLVFAETVSRLLFPFMITFLLVFLVIFEYLCGAFAEITRFADRRFFSDWWNSSDWLEFSREWNIPVHHFFRRHVYTASRNTMSRPVATFITFLISSLAHEVVMGCITRKFRGYGFVAMMLQMPIVLVQRSKWVRSRKLLNNVLFWCSMILGLSMMCALYVLV